MFHYFKTINALGAEEVFPESYSEDATLKDGTITSYYKVKEMNYGDKMVSGQGIAYFVLIILTCLFYFMIWWSHKRNILGKLFDCFALLTSPKSRPVRITSLRNRGLAYKPDTYNFARMEKYRDTLPAVEAELFKDASDDVSRPMSPDKSAVDSQYDLNMRSEANSGDDVMDNKYGKDGQGMNIYRNDPSNDHQNNPAYNLYTKNRVDSEDLEEVEVR